MEKLTEQHLKKKIRNFITLNSVTKDEIRQEYNEIYDKLKEYEDKQGWISVEEIRTEIKAKMETYKELFEENETDFYRGKIDAFDTVLIELDEFEKKYIGE